MFDPPSFTFSIVRSRALAHLTGSPLPPAKTLAVMAPTGFGKTVLLSALYDHFRTSGMECLWLALDDRDTTIARVLGHLERLLRPLASEVDVMQALHQGDVPMEERISSLLGSLQSRTAATLLFLDNLNLCTDPALGTLVDALVFRSPASLHLAFSSTSPIAYNRALAKLEHRAHEVLLADLCLDAREIGEMLGPALRARLTAETVAAIQRQTEGWPAAVRLVEIILSSASDPASAVTQFSGADEDLAELLNRQVLQGLDPGPRRFLTEIALLRAFSVELCQHVTGIADSARHVDYLIRHNLFVIPLDRNRRWYRLHGLFRQFLLEEARREVAAVRRREILSRAAHWCEEQGQWQDSVDYAIESGEWTRASATLERVAATFVRDRGDLRQYIDWVERLQESRVHVGWEADYWYVWALVFHRRYELARRQAERLTLRLDAARHPHSAPPEREAFRRRIEVIQIAIDTYTDRLADAFAHGERWLAGGVRDDPFSTATIASATAIYLTAEFRLGEARTRMGEAQSQISQARSSYGEGWVSLLASLVGVQEGNYAGAYADLQGALERARSALGESSGICGTLAVAAAHCAVEMGLDGEARILLGAGLRRLHSHGIVETAACGLDAAVKLWSDAADDGASLADLRAVAAAYPPRLSEMLSCYLVRRLLRLGRLEEARALASQAGISSQGVRKAASGASTGSARALRSAAEIELLIAAGRFRPATVRIAEELQGARAEGRFGRLTELALDQATICTRSDNPGPAARHLVHAVGLAARRRHLRPFRDRADMIAGLVNETRPKDWGLATEDERRFFAEVCGSLPVTRAADGSGQRPGLVLTPTARELELLSLIDAGLSNQQLADRLSVSVATVKWHLYNIYNKLGVSSRSAALARARSLSLLRH